MKKRVFAVSPKNTASAKLGREVDGRSREARAAKDGRPVKRLGDRRAGERHPALRQDVPLADGHESQTHLDPRIKNPGSRPRREPGPETMCWAKKRNWTEENDSRCRNPLGYKTTHFGVGRCWIHGGNAPITHGLTSMITHGRLKDLIQQMNEAEIDVMDLSPEAMLLRAMIVDYVNRYDDFIDQLDTWYNQLDMQRKESSLPPVPRKFPTLEDAGALIEAISRIVERIHKMKKEGSITLDVFRGCMTQMGLTVARHVTDDDVLKKIEADWGNILVEPRSPVKGGDYLAAQQLDDGDEE